MKVPLFQGALLEGKKALVIGAGGIGRSVAATFAANGCEVLITGTNEERLESTRQSIGSDKVQTMLLNVLDIDKLERSVEKAAELLGGLDILVYSAGIHGNDPFGSVKEDTWDSVMDINLKGMYFTDQAVANYMKRNRIKGHILNVGSASCNKPGWTPYEISKNAVRALTLGFADKLAGDGIIVNSIAPGPVATPMIGVTEENLSWAGNPCGRVATPEEIANIALVMVSEMGDLIVGDTFFVSGGSGTTCLDR